MSVIRFLRMYAPGIVLLALFALPELSFAADDIGTRSCAFGGTFSTAVVQFMFGISVLLFLLAIIGGGTAMRSGGGGGEVVGGAIGGVVGVGIILALVAMVTLFAALAATAAGQTACS